MPVTRNRVIYAGTTVLASASPSWHPQTGSYDLKLLKRIQSSSIGINTPVTRAKQVGSSDFTFERYYSYPQVSVNLNYLLSDNSNELLLGLNATGNIGMLSGLNGQGKDRNLFFLIHDKDGSDADSITSPDGSDVIGIGNCFITNYEISAAVGQLAQATVSFDCLNAVFQSYSASSITPSIDLRSGTKSTGTYSLAQQNLSPANYLTNQSSRSSALAPGDIKLTFEQPTIGGARYSGSVPVSINSISVNIPIERRDLLGLGSNYPYDKKIIFPIIGTVAFDGTFDEPVTGDFSSIFDDENKYDFSVDLKTSLGATGFRFEIKDAKIENQSFDLSIGSNMEFKSEFTFAISETNGFIVSGASRLSEYISY